MAILGILMPNVIARFAGVLFVGLLVLLVGYFSATILALFGITSGVFGVLDWLSLAIFSLYIWFDWGRAMKLPKTVDNAVDVSGALIVDLDESIGVRPILTEVAILGWVTQSRPVTGCTD